MSDRAVVKTFVTGPEWCAEVWVRDTMLEVEYGPTRTAALEALWRRVWRVSRAQSAGLAAVVHEVYRADPWREWRAIWRRVASVFGPKASP